MSLFALAGCDCIASRRVRAWLLVAVMLGLNWAVPSINQLNVGVTNPSPLESGLDYKAVDIVASDGNHALPPRAPFVELPRGYAAIVFPSAPSLEPPAERAFDARAPPANPIHGGLSTQPHFAHNNAIRTLVIL